VGETSDFEDVTVLWQVSLVGFWGNGQSLQEIDRFLFVRLAWVGIARGHTYRHVTEQFLQILQARPFHG
jgi:hypothetical protein